MTGQSKLDLREFREAAAMYCQYQLSPDLSDKELQFALEAFYAGGLGCAAVLANRAAARANAVQSDTFREKAQVFIDTLTEGISELQVLNKKVREGRNDE